jgi:DNA repair protein RecN (Recombination protein N)
MLKHLLIENYALIDHLDMAFKEELTVITGETGAGKSILLGALALILGQRADTMVLMDKNRKCIVEGTFFLKNITIKDLFEKYQLDFDEMSNFRREITPQGKSRAFVNDTPVNLSVMRELAEKLIDIHSQHQTLLIGESSFQFDVIDSFSKNTQLVNQYRAEYREWVKQKTYLADLEEKEKRAIADLDYFKFQFDELDKAKLNTEEYEKLDGELEILRHAEDIKLGLEKASFAVATADINLLGIMNEVLQSLRPIARFNEKYQQLLSRLESVIIEVKDLNAEIENESENVLHDPEHTLQLQQRLDLLNKLLLKHNAANINELQQIRNDYQSKIKAIDSLDDQISELKKALKNSQDRLQKKAEDISVRRRNVISEMEKQISGLLKQLGMPGARFLISRTDLSDLSLNGIDHINFLFSANPGAEPREIARVASGGELSRLMLSIKSMISQRNLLPTIIFDEIDAGISGETATKVANILENISKNMQVITITHLPQIASRGRTHLLVYKTIDQGRAITGIKSIDNQDRILEIAKMLGGEKPTEVMLATARQLIFNTVKN